MKFLSILGRNLRIMSLTLVVAALIVGVLLGGTWCLVEGTNWLVPRVGVYPAVTCVVLSVAVLAAVGGSFIEWFSQVGK